VVGLKPPTTYEFAYGVQTPDGAGEFGHSEGRSALGTSGQYHVNTPGSFQYVSYNVPDRQNHGVAVVPAIPAVTAVTEVPVVPGGVAIISA
jgi:hypothetical protein